MLGDGILKETAFSSPLAEASILKPKGGGGKRSVHADLLLTALIDAFSILVIFLLMNFSSTGEILYINKGIELPKAAQADLLQRNTVIKVENEKLFVEDKEVSNEALVQTLLDVRQKFLETHPGEEFPGIATVQADRRAKYESLNQVVLSLSHAGYSDIHFAVLMQ